MATTVATAVIQFAHIVGSRAVMAVVRDVVFVVPVVSVIVFVVFGGLARMHWVVSSFVGMHVKTMKILQFMVILGL
jgi:hypothetical protein